MSIETAAKRTRIALLYLGLLVAVVYLVALVLAPFVIYHQARRISDLERQLVELKVRPVAAPVSSPVVLNFYSSPDFVQGGDLAGGSQP